MESSSQIYNRLLLSVSFPANQIHWMYWLVTSLSYEENCLMPSFYAGVFYYFLQNYQSLGFPDPIWDDTPDDIDDWTGKIHKLQHMIDWCIKDDAYVLAMYEAAQMEVRLVDPFTKQPVVLYIAMRSDDEHEVESDNEHDDDPIDQVCNNPYFSRIEYLDKAAFCLKHVFRWALQNMPLDLRPKVISRLERGKLVGWEDEIRAAFA